MKKSAATAAAAVLMLSLPAALPAAADVVFFDTGSPDGKMATASRPASAGKFEIESADDFVLTAPTSITDATFTGLLTGSASTSDIGEVRVEIYRVFPNDSDVARTSGPPTFSTPKVPTRVNSPSDVELEDRDSSPSPGNLTFSVSDLGLFTAANSVLPGGIHPAPGNTTGGDGAVTGDEVLFNVDFTTPFNLAAGHYFFVPQVEITTPDDFLWLSAPRPIVPPGIPFPTGATDLQSWTRDEMLAPDWLRVGTDIVGGMPAPTFNASFSLSGSPLPEPASLTLLGLAVAGLCAVRRRGRGRR